MGQMTVLAVRVCLFEEDECLVCVCAFACEYPIAIFFAVINRQIPPPDGDREAAQRHHSAGPALLVPGGKCRRLHVGQM